MAQAKTEASNQTANSKLMQSLNPVQSRPDLDTTSTRSRHAMSGSVLVIFMFALCLAQFLAALDITIVATALPTIAEHVHVDSGEYTWVGSSYNLASTAATPLWAKCSDIWGRKAMMLMSNAIFMAGSLVAGLANSPTMLISGRTLQGAGGGGIVIMVSIIIADLFPIQERAKYYGLSAVVWAVASATGPVLGGVFTVTIGWRWCFFINLPLDAVSFALLSYMLRMQSSNTKVIEGFKTFDWIGSITMVGGMICFLCGLEGGASQLHTWSSAYSLCLLVSGIALSISFILWESYFAAHPLLPMRIFVGRSNVAALACGSFHAFVFIAFDYFLPLYYQVVLQKSPIQSGVYLFALIIPLSVFSAATGWYIKRTGNYHYAAWLGSVLMTIGTGLFVDFSPDTKLWKIVVYQIIAGIGTGMLFLSPIIALQNNLRKEDTAMGTSALTSLRTISSTLSIVIGGVVIQRNLQGGSLSSLAQEDENVNDGAGVALRRYSKALDNMWIFYVAVCGLMILSALTVRKRVGKIENASDFDGSNVATDAAHKANSEAEKEGSTKVDV